MTKTKSKDRVFHSMLEIEEEYFPESLREQQMKEQKDAKKLGIEWARESIREARRVLVGSDK